MGNKHNGLDRYDVAAEREGTALKQAFRSARPNTSRSSRGHGSDELLEDIGKHLSTKVRRAKKDARAFEDFLKRTEVPPPKILAEMLDDARKKRS